MIEESMKKQNVLHLVEYLYLGGIERLLEQLAVNTKEHANIHFFTYETTVLDGIGLEIKNKGFPVFTYKKKAGRDWDLIARLIKVIKEQNIEVLHTHDFGPVEYAVILKLRFPKLKLIHTQHTIIHFVRHKKYTRFFQFASYFYSKIIAVSDYTKNTILEYCPLMKKSALRVIANGVDTKMFSADKSHAESDVLKIVTVARISYEKNLNYLFNTCKLLKESGVPFIFHHAGIGKSPEAFSDIQKFIIENNMQNEVILHGFTNDVKSILDLGDIFVSASHTEGHPVAVLEAMASEKICFVSDILPHRELGDAVILFDKEKADSLFLALKKYSQNPAEFKTVDLKRIGRERVIAKYSIEKMVENYVEQY